MSQHLRLGVNIDHVATLRNARGSALPDPVRAAVVAEEAGADGITAHLREDRRHIRDADVPAILEAISIPLNFEMAATDEMVEIARSIGPHTSMLVPEGRQEVTTEGGLDVLGQQDRMREVVARLKDGGMIVSAFIDPDPQQVKACAEVGFDVCEVHTGPYAHAFMLHGGDMRHSALSDQLQLVADAGKAIRDAGMRFNAGHALNYHNVQPIAALEGIDELHIGHSIVCRSVFVGLRSAVAEMKSLMLSASAS